MKAEYQLHRRKGYVCVHHGEEVGLAWQRTWYMKTYREGKVRQRDPINTSGLLDVRPGIVRDEDKELNRKKKKIKLRPDHEKPCDSCL